MIRYAVALLFASTLVLAACGDDSGGDGGGSSERDAIIERLQEEGESPESAACFADELSDYDLADIESFIDGENEDSELTDAVLAAAEVCVETDGPDSTTTVPADADE